MICARDSEQKLIGEHRVQLEEYSTTSSWPLNKIKLRVANFATASTAVASIYSDLHRLRLKCAGHRAIRFISKSLSYDESCCLHLFVCIESNDSDLRLGEVTLASFDRTNNIVWITAAEHWQFVQRPVPVVVVTWPHCRVQVNVTITRDLQARRPFILDHELNLLADVIILQLRQIRQRLVLLSVERRIRLHRTLFGQAWSSSHVDANLPCVASAWQAQESCKAKAREQRAEHKRFLRGLLKHHGCRNDCTIFNY